MSLLIVLYIAILFFVISLYGSLQIVKSGNKYVVAIVHALVFTILFRYTVPLFNLEGFDCNRLKKDVCEKHNNCWWMNGVVQGCAKDFSV